MLKNLKELISINSSLNGDKIINYLKETFMPISEEILIIQNKENENKSIIIGLNTKLRDVEPIVLSGHIDTVVPDLNKYKTNPFELTTIGNKAYGLGSIDMKSFTAVILDKIKDLKQINTPIIISLTTDEETELKCIENVIEKFKELNIKPKFTIVGEPTRSEINNIAKGCYEFEIKVFGKACHSSILNEGINSICVMAKIISFIEEKQNDFFVNFKLWNNERRRYC